MSPKVHVLSALSRLFWEQPGCLSPTQRTNKHRSINTVQSAKRKKPDSHMIRPDHDSGLYRTENQPKKIRNARYPQCPGVIGAEARYCWAHLALADISWLSWRDRQALVLSHPYSVPGTEATHAKASNHVTQTKAWH